MKFLERLIRWIVNTALDALERRSGAVPTKPPAIPRPEYRNGDWGDRTDPGFPKRRDPEQ